MDMPLSPLVLTKLRAPAARARLTRRPRLAGLLARESGKNFILVSAPAGYGKTTLLSGWAQTLLSQGDAAAWYSLDPGDDSPASFGAYLVASLAEALGPDSGLAPVGQRLRASPEIDLQKMLPPVINAIHLSGRNLTLFLDDYHLIASPAIHGAMAYLLEHLPQNMRVVIGSRADPPLPLGRLRARGRLLEIRAAQLRFTASETESFLNQVMDLELSPAGVAALETRTEGWVAGLQLAALSLAGRSDKEGLIASFGGGHRYLVEYLLDEVFERQPGPVQAFLLSTSILERLCAPLCDALLGEMAGSAAILEGLERSNLFVVALDDQGTWYRYHHLFRDFLLARLQKAQPGQVAPLHRLACEWLAARHLLREAAAHAFHTGDWEYAAAFVETHSFDMIVHGELSTLFNWCSAFPEAVMQAHPFLCLHQCWALALSFRRQDHPRIEARLRQVEQAVAALQNRQQASDLFEATAVVRGLMALAPDPAIDLPAQLALGRRMLAAYPEGDPGQFSALLTLGYVHMALPDAPAATRYLEAARAIAIQGGLFLGMVESTFHLARLSHSQGQLRRAASLCRQGQVEIAAVLPQHGEELPALGGLDIALGCVLLEQDQLAEAETHLLHGLERMGIGNNPYFLLAAQTALARLCEIQGRRQEALAAIDRLEERWPDIAFYTRALRLRLALRAAPDDPAALAEADAWCAAFSSYAGGALPGVGPCGGAEAFYQGWLTWIRAQIALGNPAEALAEVERQLAPARANGLSGRVIELLLLCALAWDTMHDSRRARQALADALAAGQVEGFIRSFDQGPALNRLLIQAAADGCCPGYRQRILAALDLEAAPQSAQRRLVSGEILEALSARELEVLRLMAQGATNLEIAGRFVITVGTVKSHINHILRKLDAHNRTEAVARARQLGLIS